MLFSTHSHPISAISKPWLICLDPDLFGYPNSIHEDGLYGLARFLRHLASVRKTAILCHKWFFVSKQIIIHQGFLIVLWMGSLSPSAIESKSHFSPYTPKTTHKKLYRVTNVKKLQRHGFCQLVAETVLMSPFCVGSVHFHFLYPATCSLFCPSEKFPTRDNKFTSCVPFCT